MSRFGVSETSGASCNSLQKQSYDRLGFLDALRAVAALAVFVSHALPEIEQTFLTRPLSILLGQAGVILFFLVSGFVISLSIERSASLRIFWIRRVCRLYPLYWLSIGITLLVGLLIDRSKLPVDFTQRPFVTVFANLSMLQYYLGVSHLRDLYWTLSLELVFYVLVTGAFALQLLRVPWIHVSVFGVAALLSNMFAIGDAVELCSYLMIMWLGTVVFYSTRRLADRRMLWGSAVLCLAVLVVVTDPIRLLGRLLGMLVFAYILWRSQKTHPALVSLGTISYSLYLMHIYVIWFVPQTSSAMTTILLWLTILIPLASLTYWVIEKPGMALGRSLTVSPSPRASSPAIEAEPV